PGREAHRRGPLFLIRRAPAGLKAAVRHVAVELDAVLTLATRGRRLAMMMGSLPCCNQLQGIGLGRDLCPEGIHRRRTFPELQVQMIIGELRAAKVFRLQTTVKAPRPLRQFGYL